MTTATAMPVQATATEPVNTTPFTDDEVMFFYTTVTHALDAMIAEGNDTKEMAKRIAEFVGASVHSPYYYLVCGVLAGMDEGVSIVQAMNSDKKTATPTDESKDCR